MELPVVGCLGRYHYLERTGPAVGASAFLCTRAPLGSLMVWGEWDPEGGQGEREWRAGSGQLSSTWGCWDLASLER